MIQPNRSPWDQLFIKSTYTTIELFQNEINISKMGNSIWIEALQVNEHTNKTKM